MFADRIWRRWLRRGRTPSMARRQHRYVPHVEELEGRTVPTIVFTPQFGPDLLDSSPPFNSSANGVMSSATVYLILWGPAWSLTPNQNQSDANVIINETKAVIGSGVLNVLKQYGSDGAATFGGFYIDNSTPPAGFAVATGSGFAGNSYTEAENEISSAINGGFLPGPAGGPTLATAPIYTIVTDPAHSFDGFGDLSNGGVNRDGVVTSGTFSGATINMMGVGTGHDSSFQEYGLSFSHELQEKMSEPGGRPGNPPPAAYGVVVSPPADIVPYLKDAPFDPVTFQDNWDQICDFEPEAGFTLNSGFNGAGYTYRLGGTSGVEVQAAYSNADKAFVVEDGNAAVFTLKPDWTISTSNANNDFFDGTFDLTIDGDQLANKDDNITISRDAAGGIQVSLDGQIANFDPGTTTTNGTAIRSITVNGMTGTNVLTLDFTNGNFLTAMNPNGDALASGLIDFNGGTGTSTLVLKGGSFNHETVTPTSALAGSLCLDANVVSYTNVLPVFLTGAPEDQTVPVGGNAIFSASAIAAPAVSVQWQHSTDSLGFLNIPNATSTTLTVPNVQAGQAGQYRAVFTNADGQITTAKATLTVNFTATVGTRPQSLTVLAGSTVTLAASAAGNPAPTVQWRVSSNNGRSFNPLQDGNGIQGSTTNTLTFPAQPTDSGQVYEAVFTNQIGVTATAPLDLKVVAPVSVSVAPVVVVQPANQTVALGDQAVFIAEATGDPMPPLQWQLSTDKGKTFTDVSGATNDVLVVTGQNLGANLYRAKVTGSQVVFSRAALLTVEMVPQVSVQVNSLNVNAGQLVKFTATATGSAPLSFQWQQLSTGRAAVWTNIPGARGTTLSFAAQASQNGSHFRVVVSNAVGSTPSPSDTLTVNFPPVVTCQPANQTVAVSTQASSTLATFTASVSGNPMPFFVQWEFSTDKGRTFTLLTDTNGIQGATTDTLLVTAHSTDSGNEYRAKFFSSTLPGSPTAISKAALLTVDIEPSATVQPISASVNAGQLVTFVATIGGTAPLSLHWQQLGTTPGATWTNIPGATGARFSFTAAAAQNGDQFRIVVQNAVDRIASAPATLTVRFAPVVTQQPVAATVAVGDTARFTAVAAGNPTPSVAWQVSTDNGKTFTNLTDGAVIQGSAMNTLVITAAQSTDSGTEYRAMFTSGSTTVFSQAARLTVEIEPSATVQPTSASVQAGQLVTFVATIGGTAPLSLHWQQLGTTPGATWTNMPGATGARFSFTAAAAQNGDQFRIVVQNAVDRIPSAPATLTVSFAPVVTQQPVAATVAVGGTAQFTAAAAGNPMPSVVWQVSTDNGKTFANLADGADIQGSTTNTLIVSPSLADSGSEFRALFTSPGSAPVFTRAAVLTVHTKPAVTIQAGSLNVTAGTLVTLSATVSGSAPVALVWQESADDGNTRRTINGASGPTLSFTARGSQNGYQFRASASNDVGSVMSNILTLAVQFAPVING